MICAHIYWGLNLKHIFKVSCSVTILKITALNKVWLYLAGFIIANECFYCYWLVICVDFTGTVMAGRSKGRGRSQFTFSVDALGFGRGDSLPQSTHTPSPLFPVSVKLLFKCLYIVIYCKKKHPVIFIGNKSWQLWFKRLQNNLYIL